MSFMITRWMARKPSRDKAALVCLVLVACNAEKPTTPKADPARAASPEPAPPDAGMDSEQPATAPRVSAAPSAAAHRDPRDVVCPRYRAPAAHGTLRERRLSEISGLAFSPAQAIFWTHNDSGDEARVYALSVGTSWLGTFRLAGLPKPTDVEDIAIAEHGGSWNLYLGDIGDNQRMRREIQVHRFEEPKVDIAPGFVLANRERPTAEVSTVRLRYPDGAEDAEALLVESGTEAITIITKAFLGPPKVYVRSGFTSGTLTLAGSMTPEITGYSLQLVTAAASTTKGDFVTLRTYDAAYLFRRTPGQTMAQALLGPACVVQMGPEKQGEAITFVEREGQAPDIATMSEGKVSTLWITEAEPGSE